MIKPDIVLIIHNIRSVHNVGAILRTSEAFGLEKVIISGYSPYPELKNDSRLPHIRIKQTKYISKTSLGAEKIIKIEHYDQPPILKLKTEGYKIVALEQSPKSINIRNYNPPSKMALIIGEEVNGVSRDLLAICDEIVEIEMHGQKESFNVSVAVGIALYALTT